MISINKVKKLYDKLYEVCGVGNINYHQFKDNHLYPIYMMGSDMLGDAQWKATHAKARSWLTIDTDIVLKRIVKGETVYIYDVPTDPAASPAFKLFGIKSLIIWPLYDKDNITVNGLICIPDIYKNHEFSKDVQEKCHELIKEFNKEINEDKVNAKVAEVITNYLGKNGVKEIYGIPCSTFSPMLDTLLDMKEIEFIRVSNESCASFSAETYAKLSGKLGVCLMSGAAGVPNALNGIIQAKESKSPILVLSGYVNTFEEGLGAMHNFEIHNILDNVVKYNKVIKRESDVLKELKKAIEIAMTPPKGPVHIGLPLDILKKEFSGQDLDVATILSITNDESQFDRTVLTIDESKNGLIIVGGGCRGLAKEVIALAEKLDYKIVTTTGGKGVINEEHRLCLGNFGFVGTDIANEIVLNDKNIDTIIALGTQLTAMATLNFDKRLTENRTLIQIDNDPIAFNKGYNTDIGIISDLKFVLNYLTENVKQKDRTFEKPYLNKPTKKTKGLCLRDVYEELGDLLPDNTIYISDIGTSMHYSYKFLRVPQKGDFYCNTLRACMGSSIGAIGASFIDKQRPVVTLVGDGSFLMNYMGELPTITRYNLPILTIVLNNSALEYVRIGHDVIHGRHPECFESKYINIHQITEGLGIECVQVKNLHDLEFLRYYKFEKPFVVELIIDDTSDMPLGRLELLSKH